MRKKHVACSHGVWLTWLPVNQAFLVVYAPSGDVANGSHLAGPMPEAEARDYARSIGAMPLDETRNAV